MTKGRNMPLGSFLLSCLLVCLAGFATGFLSAWLQDVIWQHVKGLVYAVIEGLQLSSVLEVWR